MTHHETKVQIQQLVIKLSFKDSKSKRFHRSGGGSLFSPPNAPQLLRFDTCVMVLSYRACRLRAPCRLMLMGMLKDLRGGCALRNMEAPLPGPAAPPWVREPSDRRWIAGLDGPKLRRPHLATPCCLPGLEGRESAFRPRRRLP